MDEVKFKAAYNECRNGADKFYRHPLARNFAYSNGVQECAEAGCYWLLDILGTELPSVFRANEHISNMASVHVVVRNSAAHIRAEFEDDHVAWRKEVDITDLPDGDYVFLVADEFEGECRYRMILVSEY